MNFNIILSADENYIKYASVLIYSILKNIDKTKTFKDFSSKSFFFGGGQESLVFHILSDFISKENTKKLEKLEDSLNHIFPTQIKIHKVKNDIFEGLPTLGGNYVTYYRLLFFDFAKDFITKDLQRCLYLDVDMLVLCDIREIFALSLDKALGAVKDFGRYGGRILKGTKNIKLDKSYFNGGFLLIDTKYWEEQDCKNKAFKIARDYDLKFHDQDILNVLFMHNYTEISFAYDFIVQAFGASVCKDEHKHFNIPLTRKEFTLLEQNPKILHYCGEKPWSKGEISYTNTQGISVTKLWWDKAKEVPYFNVDLKIPKSDSTPHNLRYFILQDFKYFGILKRIIQIKSMDISSLPFYKNDKNANYAYELGNSILRLKQKPLLVFIVRIFRVFLRLKRIIDLTK